MKLSKKTVYAIVLMLAIAKNGDNGNITIKEIADRENISVKYLEQIVNVLCKAGLVKSHRGSKGGYRLSKAADKYTLGSIIRIMEDTIMPEYIDEVKSLAHFWHRLYDTVNDFIDGITLSDLLYEEQIINENYDYCI